MTHKQIPKITSHRPAASVPEWAVLERSLIALMNQSEDIILEHLLAGRRGLPRVRRRGQRVRGLPPLAAVLSARRR